jgi:hypothetical protein
MRGLSYARFGVAFSLSRMRPCPAITHTEQRFILGVSFGF